MLILTNYNVYEYTVYISDIKLIACVNTILSRVSFFWGWGIFQKVN